MGISMGRIYTALKLQPLTQAALRTRTPLMPLIRTLQRLQVQARYSPITRIPRVY